MTTKLKIIAIAVAGLIVVSIAILYITRNSSPVLLRYGSHTTADGSAFVVQNPFRERAPEDEAEKLLQDLKAGKCEKVLNLPGLDAEKIASTCQQESTYFLQDWSLVDRTDIGKQTIFVYKVVRNNRGGSGTETAHLAWIDVEKTGEESWRVLSYQTYY